MQQQILIVIVIIFLFLLVFFLYAQYNITKRQLILVNKDGEQIRLTVEIADSFPKKARGLMFRESLGQNEGMLFIFDNPARHSFWMVNTTIPLDAIYFDENQTVVDIIHMDPCNLSCAVYKPESDAKYVLEVNQGFAVLNKIEKGNSRFILE